MTAIRKCAAAVTERDARKLRVNSDSDPDRPSRVFHSVRRRYHENRDFDANASWREWLRERYAKYWYGIGSLVLDGMVVGVILANTDPSQIWPVVLAAVLVVGLLYLELQGLGRFWPPKSPD